VSIVINTIDLFVACGAAAFVQALASSPAAMIPINLRENPVTPESYINS
jgi:hypothetical protein